MRVAALGAIALATTLAMPASADTGPFTGSVRQSQTRTHQYDNNPMNLACPQVIVNYTVELTYTPTTDVLTLEARGMTAVGSNGYAALSFQANYCTRFAIQVTGTSVARKADYTVTVTRGGGTTL